MEPSETEAQEPVVPDLLPGQWAPDDAHIEYDEQQRPADEVIAHPWREVAAGLFAFAALMAAAFC